MRTLPWTALRRHADEDDDEEEEDEEAAGEPSLSAVPAWTVRRRRTAHPEGSPSCGAAPTPWAYGQHGRGAYPPNVMSLLMPSTRLHAANAAAAAAAVHAADDDVSESRSTPPLSRPSLLRPRKQKRTFATRELPWTVLRSASQERDPSPAALSPARVPTGVVVEWPPR